MDKILWSKRIYLVFKYLIALIFIYSGITKLFNPYDFSVIIEAYGLIPESLSFLAGICIASLEVIAALFLIFEIKGGLGTITLMMIFFISILIYGINLGLDTDCGCFGPEDPEGHAFSNLQTALKRDFVFLGMIFYLYFWKYRNGKINFLK